MKNRSHHESTARISGSIVAVVLAISASQSAFAASGTWTGATNNIWQTSSNWDASPFPGDTSGFSSTDIATFSAAGSGTIDLGGTLNVQSIRMGANGGSAGALIIGDAGDALNLTSGGNITVGAGVTANQIIGTAGGSVNLSTAANSTYSINNYGTGTLTIAAPVTSSQTTGNVSVLTLGGSGNGSVTGVLSGTDTAGNAGLGVVKNGSGTWTLSGANTFAGAAAINGGRMILDYATNDPISTAPVTISGGALDLKGHSAGTTETISSLVLGSSVGSVSTLTLDANGGAGVGLTIGTFNGGTSGSIVNLIDLSSSSSNSIAISSLGTSAAVAVGVLQTGTTFGSRSATIVVRDSTGYGFATLSGASSGTLGRLTTGTELTANNSTATNVNYRLTTSVTREAALNYNTLTIDSAAGDITLDMGSFNFATGQGRAILVSGANDVTIDGTGNLGSVALFSNYSSGTLSVSLAGATSGLLFAGTGFTDYSGSISGASIVFTVGGGIVRLSKDHSLPSLFAGYHVAGGGVLEIGADLNGATAGDFSRPVGTASGNIRFTGDSGLSAAGTDRVVNFGGAVTPTTITWGSSAFLTDLGGATDGGYTLKLSSAKSDAKLTIQNPIALGTNTHRVIDVANGTAATDAVLSGVISGTGATLVKQGAGKLSLDNVNTYSGATIISAGTLALGTTGTIANSAIINLGTSGSQGTLDLTAKTSGFTIGSDQTLSGYGTVNIGGAGNVLTIAGTFAPGNSPGIVTVNGDLTLASGSTTNMEIVGRNGGSPVAGTDYDQASVSGTVTFDGTLNISTTVTLLGGESFQLFDAASYDGHFTSVAMTGLYAPTLTYNGTDSWTGTDLASNLGFTFAETTGILSVTAVPEPSTYAMLVGVGSLLCAFARRKGRASRSA